MELLFRKQHKKVYTSTIAIVSIMTSASKRNARFLKISFVFHCHVDCVMLLLVLVMQFILSSDHVQVNIIQAMPGLSVEMSLSLRNLSSFITHFKTQACGILEPAVNELFFVMISKKAEKQPNNNFLEEHWS